MAQQTTYPVVQIYGPVVEGEGPWVGHPTAFVRMGYCDYRCKWCDSDIAVQPDLVKKNAEYLTPQQMIDRVTPLIKDIPRSIVTISGGNPLLWDLEPFIFGMKRPIFALHPIKVETQGTVWRPWLRYVSLVMVSPKPPSAGNFFKYAVLKKFMSQCQEYNLNTAFKFVVFDQLDLEFAFQVMSSISRDFLMPHDDIMYLSCGTDLNDSRDSLGERYAWLCRTALSMAQYTHRQISILPQVHVLAYLHKQGV